MSADEKREWTEVEPPKGLDVAGLGQTPVDHEGTWYVKHPHTGKVLAASPVYAANVTFGTLAKGLQATQVSGPMLALRGAIANLLQTMDATAGSPVPAQLQQQLAAAQSLAQNFTQAASSGAVNVRQNAPGDSGPPPTNTGIGKPTVGILSGAAGLLAGFGAGWALKGKSNEQPARPR